MAYKVANRQTWHQFAGAAACAVLVFLAWTTRRKVLAADTLVVYVFSDTEEQYSENLRFFLTEAVRGGDGADYFIILQGGTQAAMDKLPKLPKNAKYVLHENQCYDLGSVGWLINESGLVARDHYKFLIWLNSSARGPFLPKYARAMTWHRVFTKHLDKQVKLVGATMSCEKPTNLVKEAHHVPHVQTYVVATDAAGLRVLQNAAVFTCHRSYEAAVLRGELAVSRAIVEAGFNMDSLMARYQGVDWQNRTNWDCNSRLNPIHGKSMYDGVDVHPYEVLFVKVKQGMMEQEWPSVKYALKYQKWALPGPRNITANERITRIVELATEHGERCFDHDYYRRVHPSLQHMTDKQLLEHFVHDGAKEGRKFRFRCGHRKGPEP